MNMKENWTVLFSAIVLLALCTSSFSQGAPDAQIVIETSAELETASAKKAYLIEQAKEFLIDKKYDEAFDIAQHVLKEIDASSSEAQNIIESVMKAQTAKVGVVDEVLGQTKDTIR